MKCKIMPVSTPITKETVLSIFRFNLETCLRHLWLVAIGILVATFLPEVASAQSITWGAVSNISGDTDVSTNGTELYAYFLGTGSKTVNGATFTGSSGNTAWGNVGFNSSFTGTTTGFGVNAPPFNSLSTAYSNVLTGGAYGSTSTGTVTLNGLIVGHAYAVQIWVNDSRAGISRTEDASSTGGNSVTLQYNIYQALGGSGQFVVGTFAATATTQSFTLAPSASGSVQLNAISVFDLGSSSKTWLGSSDTSWGTSGNWNPGGAPIAGDSVTFNSLSTANRATLLDTSYILSSLTLSNVASAVSIGSDGNTLTVNNGINLLGTGQSLTVSDAMVLGRNQTWNVTNNCAFNANNGVSGSAALTITGGGIVSLGAPATYTGNTTIVGGTLALSGSGSLASTRIIIAGGADFDVSASTSTFALNSATLENSSSGAMIGGNIDCTSGTLSLLSDGINPCFIQTNGTMTLSSATVVTVNNTGAVLGSGNHIIVAAATAGTPGQVAYSGALPSVNVIGNGAVAPASLAISVSGDLVLVIATADVWTGANDNTWMNGGNWSPANEPAAGDGILFNNLSTANLSLSQNDPSAGAQWGVSVFNPSGPVTIGGPNSLQIYSGGFNLANASQNLAIASPLVINANQNWMITNSRTLTISGPVSTISGGNVTVTGGGKVQMGAADILDGLTNNVGTGDFTINSTLDLNGNSQAMNGLSGTSAGTVDNSGAGAATLTVGGNGDSGTFSGIVQNTGGPLTLQVAGGNFTLNSTNNSYRGGTILNQGATFWFPSSYSVGSGPVTFNSGSIYSAGVNFTNALTLNDGYLHIGGNNDNQVWSGPVTVANGFEMSGDNGNCQIILSGPMNIGTGGISVTNFGNNGPVGGYQVGLGDVLSGPISGSGGITYFVNGSNSRLTVQGTNTYTGGTVVNGTSNGKLNVYGGNYSFGNSPVTLNSGALIEVYPGSATISNALTLNGGTLYTESQYNNYNQLTWAGPVTMTANSSLFEEGTANNQQSAGVVVSGPLNVNGYTLTCGGTYTLYVGHTINGSISGTGLIQETNLNLTLGGSNTFSGTVEPVGGALSVNNVYALQNATLDMNPADSGTVTMNNLNVVIGALIGTRNLALGSGTVTIGNNGSSTSYSGLLTGNSLIKNGTGTLTLSSNAYSGNTTVNGGTLAVQQPTFSFGSTVTVTNGAVLELDFPATNVVTALVLNGVSKPHGIYNSVNSSPYITGTGAIQVGATPDIWTGALSSEWSTNTLGSPYNWEYNGITGTNYTDGSAVQFDDTAANTTVNISLQNVLPVGVTFNNNINSYTVQGSFGIAGTAALTKSGTNTVTLLTPNAFTGNMAINGGKVTVGSSGSLGTTYSGAITFANGGTLEYSSATSATLSGNITGSGALTLDSATSGASLSLSGVNSYSGITTITNNSAGGSRLITTATSISPNTTFNVAGTTTGGGQLFANGGTISNNMTISGVGFKESSGIQDGAIRVVSGDTLSGTITLAGNSRISGVVGNGTATIAGQITGNYYLDFNMWFNNSSTTFYIILANTNIATPNNYTGTTFLENNFYSGSSAGNNFVLKLGANEQIPSGPGMGIVEFTGYNGNRLNTLELNGFNQTVDGLLATTAGPYSIIQNTAAGASTLSVGAGNTNSSFSGNITDGGTGKTLALTKIGTGTLTLSGIDSYNGGTAINGGSLLINNASGNSGTGTGAVKINSGGTLGGTGYISGPITNNAGGALSPGVGGVGKLTLSGNVTLLAGSTNTFVVNGTTVVASNSVALGATITYGGVLNIVTNGTFTLGQTFMLFSGAGATNTGNFASITGSPGSGLAFSFTNGILSVVSAVTGPTLTSVTPNPVTGSSYPVSLGLTGSGFTGATAVLLTNVTASAGASYVPTVNSGTSITVHFVPGTTAGTWNATVVNGTPSSQVGFTVTVPAEVMINGAGLNSAGAGKLVLSGTGGVPGSSYAVQSSTNLNPPVAWVPVVTNTFDGSGNFYYTNTVSTSTPQLFLRVQQ